ncbi:MAG: GNAT family N-acetyltransferase [Pseudomonadales bacterium]|nr:GNAT family N-acetyltransferase [Pseudomonadales bacterium]
MPVSSPQSQSDPLDLLSAALLSAHGDDSMLCYGGDTAATDLRASQTALLSVLEQVAKHELSESANVLLSGSSLGRLQASLADTGYNVTIANSEADSLQAEYFELAVVEGSILYLDQLALFTQLRKLVKDEGRIILFGENLDDDSKIERSELANLSSLQQLAERLGFALLQQQDFTAAAVNSLDLLLKQVASDDQRLMQSLGWDEERLSAAIAELKFMRTEFSIGRRCFRLFEFSKLSHPPGEYAQAVYGDIHSFEPTEVVQLFEESFGVDFDPELWHWKYQLGNGTCVAVRDREGGDIVSHYGGAPRKIDYFGEPSMAIQPCDVMVLPEVRRHYGKNSLFFKTAATFLEREIGNTVRQLLGFGFPNQKAMNIALRLGLYEKTDDFVEVVHPLPNSTDQTFQFAPVDMDNSQHRESIDRLWQQMREGFNQGIIGARDSDYVYYRYFQHPFAKRGLLTSNFILDGEGEVLAFVVFKEHEQQQLLMDILCSKDQLQTLLTAAAAYCAAQAQVPMKMWITQGWLELVRVEGCTVNALGIEIPCNSWNPGPSSQVLYGKWWLTAGDMDFV